MRGKGYKPGLLLVALILLLLPACNPIYVTRAGWAQARILASREPLTQVMADPELDRETAGKLRLVHDARLFAIEELGFRNAGDAYTTFAQLPSDTLVLVLSAAYRDRLAMRSWWFPVVGRVPYRGYFSLRSAERARDRMEAEGYDTNLRPAAAFSTLGWFADPLHSTLLRLDEGALVETVLHELAHNHLFVPGQGRFNESFANFAGARAAIEFFCRREGGGPDTVKCERARHRWADMQDVSRYLMALGDELHAMYAREDLPPEVKIEERDRIYREARLRFRNEVQPGLRATRYEYLAAEPFNNATFLARALYYHRLPDFEALFQARGGDFAALMAWLREEAPGQDDPFSVLELLR